MTSTKQNEIVLFGAGRMGSALAGGWVKSGLGGRIRIIDPFISPHVQAWVDDGDVSVDPEVGEAGVLVVAVKPQMFPALAVDIAKWVGPDTQIMSVMAGIPLAQLRKSLGTDKVARAMPNTPGLIGQGVTTLCLPADAPDGTEEKLRALLEPLGSVEGPISEDLLPAATAVAGSGPAYGFLLAEVMAAAGVAHGLEPDMAMRLARATVQGSGALMAEASEDAATLRKNVTSPGGVTAAALEVLMEESALPAIFEQAIGAAIARDLELAKAAE